MTELFLNLIMEKRSTLIFLIILISFLFLASIVEAQAKNIGDIFKAVIKKISEWANYLAGVAFGFCAILIATSGGNPGRLAQVKEALTYIVIGWILIEFTGAFIAGLRQPGGIAEGLGLIVKGLAQIAIIGGIMYLVYGIFEFATSGGDPFKMEEAKTAIMWAVIGIVIGTAVTALKVTSKTEAIAVILKILGTTAGAMGTVSAGLGIFKIATSVGDPVKLREGITNIIWGAIGIAIGVILFRIGVLPPPLPPPIKV